MMTSGNLGGMLMRSYSGVNPGSSKLSETMLQNHEPILGSSNIVKKRKQKRTVDGVEAARNGVARNGAMTKDTLL